jgi:hypothetical protein
LVLLVDPEVLELLVHRELLATRATLELQVSLVRQVSRETQVPQELLDHRGHEVMLDPSVQ